MRSSEGSASNRLGVSPFEGVCFLYFKGMKRSFEGRYGFSSLRRLSAMFSNIASIFAVTSALAGRRDDAIGASNVMARKFFTIAGR